MNNYLKEIKRDILNMHYFSQDSHIGSALSCVDILAVLYFKIINIDPKKPNNKNRDRFIMSKSHAVSALYAVLAEKGFFPKNLLETYCQNKSRLPGHATRGTVPGIEASTGALGHGLPIAIGMALAAKKNNDKHRVFVLISDGECDEGTTWESALFASHHKLDNLIVIVDYNKLQALGKTNDVLNLEPLKEKWLSFGWQAKEINGHDLYEIEKTLKYLPLKKDMPNIIIANTIKGKGIKTMEGKLESHYKSPGKEEYELFLENLKN
jgi:transketolase